MPTGRPTRWPGCTTSWGHLDDDRQRLLAGALEQLGRVEESLPIRQRAFGKTLSAFDLARWLEHIPDAARPEAIAHARELALAHPDHTAAATLLLELGDPAAAEARLLAAAGRIDGNAFYSLLPLAKALRAFERARGETVIYRALLTGILDRGYARAYGHAARHWARLREIAQGGAPLMPLPSHEDFEADIRARHGRKAAFWADVNGTRRDRHDAEDDEQVGLTALSSIAPFGLRARCRPRWRARAGHARPSPRGQAGIGNPLRRHGAFALMLSLMQNDGNIGAAP
jgi:tetratricopeptide (TPR) repeat protein